MNQKQRVATVLSGKQADRPPVSFWHHFKPNELRGPTAVEAHLYHLDRYDIDFLKVMNDTGFPRPSEEWVLNDAADLASIREFTGHEAEFEMEYEIVRTLRESVGPDVPMIVTVFNAWAVFRRVCAPETDVHGPPKMDWEDHRDKTVTKILKQDRAAVGEAIGKFSRGLAKFSKLAIDAGADGVFLSVRDDWCDTPENGEGTYDLMVLPSDLEILESASGGWFNMLHVCGKALDFTRFGGYPAHILNWADRYAGPTLAEAKGHTELPLSGGVDNLNTLPNGTPKDVEREVKDALGQLGTRPCMITPGCTYDPKLVKEENLYAMIAAAHGKPVG